MTALRRVGELQGHSDSVLCCIADEASSRVFTGAEDGTLCVFDTRTRQLTMRIPLPEADAVPSLCLHPREGHTLFAAGGSSVHALDLRQTGLDAIVATHELPTDEVNSVAVHASGTYLAAALDEGDVVVLERPAQAAAAGGGRQFKRLRKAHSNIASAVAFRQHRPWELVTGGLDCRLLLWDFSRGQAKREWNLSSPAERQAEAEASAAATGSNGAAVSGGSQMFNPPMVHGVAAPSAELPRAMHRYVAVARGDGAVAVYDADAAAPSTSSSGSGRGGGKGGGKGKASPRAGGGSAAAQRQRQEQQQQQAWVLPPEAGGHTAAANHVSFFLPSAGRHVVSGGNDARLLLWNWYGGGDAGGSGDAGGGGDDGSSGGSPAAYGATQDTAAEAGTAAAAAAAGEGHEAGEEMEGRATPAGGTGAAPPRVAAAVEAIAHGRKVNCVASTRGGSVFVGDVSDIVAVYEAVG